MSKKEPSQKPGHVKRRIRSIMSKHVGLKDRNNRRPRFIGKETGLGLCRFLAELFHNNEEVPPSKRLTNEAIERILVKEYPQHKALHKNLRNGRRTVNYYRDLYNRGRWTNGEPPAKISYRYNEDGIPVSIRNGKRPMTATERAEYARRYLGIQATIRQRLAEKQLEKEEDNESQ